MSEELRIVIGYDGSDCALAALDDLRRAGLPKVARAIVLSVVETSSRPLRTQSVAAVSRQGDDGEKQLTPRRHSSWKHQGLALKATERLQQLFPLWEVHAESDWGSPASCILAKAGILQANLIVVGSHGPSALGRFFLGSVSISVATRAHCSVEVIRPQAMS